MPQCRDDPQPKPFITAREASRQLGGRPSHVTLIKWAKNGKLPGAQVIAGQVLIRQRWVDELLGEKVQDILK